MSTMLDSGVKRNDELGVVGGEILDEEISAITNSWDFFEQGVDLG